MEKVEYRATGRRKSSSARVVLIPGTGNITVNGKDAGAYFPYATLVQDLKQPLVITNTAEHYDANVKVIGGGFTGQAGAVRLGITRALILANAEYKKELRTKGMVTRDARVKERKKPGLYGARRAPQFSKR